MIKQESGAPMPKVKEPKKESNYNREKVEHIIELMDDCLNKQRDATENFVSKDLGQYAVMVMAPGFIYLNSRMRALTSALRKELSK